MTNILTIRKHWRKKRRAAQWLLGCLCHEPVWKVTAVAGEERNIRTYAKMNLKKLVVGQRKYGADLLRDAVDLLYRSHYIDLWENLNDRIDIEILALPEGEYAYKERFYDLEIIKDRNALIQSYTGWLLPLVAAILSILALTRTMTSNNTSTVPAATVPTSSGVHRPAP